MTPRQIQVALLIGEGLTYAEAGRRLGLSARTVEHHVERIADLLPRGRYALGPRDRVLLWAMALDEQAA